MNLKKNVDIYGDKNPRKMPNYTAAEASKYLRLSASTLRSWAKGRGYTYQDVYTFSEPIMGKSREGIDSLLSFEKPTLANRNISTYVIVNRIDAGEDINDVADDYDLDIQDIEDAIIYERAA